MSPKICEDWDQNFVIGKFEIQSPSISVLMLYMEDQHGLQQTIMA
jgi:hypothetical protein